MSACDFDLLSGEGMISSFSTAVPYSGVEDVIKSDNIIKAI